MLPGPLEQLVELRPDGLLPLTLRVSARIAEQDLALDEPGLFAMAPAPHDHLEAIVLDVDAGGQEPDAGGHLGCISRLPAVEVLDVEASAALLPGLAELEVDERLERCEILLTVQPIAGEFRPGLPWRIECADVKARRARARVFRNPSAGREHPVFVWFGDEDGAMRTAIGGRLGLPLFPF